VKSICTLANKTIGEPDQSGQATRSLRRNLIEDAYYQNID